MSATQTAMKVFSMKIDKTQLTQMIDLTILRLEATKEDVVRVCEEGKHFNFASVCLNPIWVSQTSKTLKGTGVKVNTVVGFSLWGNSNRG